MNLDDLNSQLFSLFQEIKEDKIDSEKAKALTGVANSIIDSVRTQIQGIRQLQASGVVPESLVGNSVRSIEASEKSTYDRKNNYAKKLGYKNLSEAIASMGKAQFEESYSENN